MRLARFNTQVGVADKRYFQGLPSPSAAALVGSLVWFGDYIEARDAGLMTTAALFITIAAALLMVSNMRYYSFKELDLHGRVPFVAVLAVVMGFVLISIEPASVLLIIFGGYAALGRGRDLEAATPAACRAARRQECITPRRAADALTPSL